MSYLSTIQKQKDELNKKIEGLEKLEELHKKFLEFVESSGYDSAESFLIAIGYKLASHSDKKTDGKEYGWTMKLINSNVDKIDSIISYHRSDSEVTIRKMIKSFISSIGKDENDKKIYTSLYPPLYHVFNSHGGFNRFGKTHDGEVKKYKPGYLLDKEFFWEDEDRLGIRTIKKKIIHEAKI